MRQAGKERYAEKRSCSEKDIHTHTEREREKEIDQCSTHMRFPMNGNGRLD
jgi:hypothetical protein